MLHVSLHVCNVAEKNRCLTLPVSKDRKASAGLTIETGIAQVCRVSGDTSFVCTLGYPDQSYTVPIVSVYNTVHCITTVLWNYTISGKIGIAVVKLYYTR